MTDTQRRVAAEAFWRDETISSERAEAVSLLAERLHFRPKSVLGMPIERRTRALASTHAISDTLAANLLVAYHLGAQRPMMAAFLDALGIPHDDGLIPEDATPHLDEARLEEAVGQLRRSFPPEDVALYLATLSMQDPDTWKPLERFQEPPDGTERGA
ncbi:MAG: hypothetical protein GEU99_01285 [Luteitalea sp.]|nr:hypothetical protein [Luteitalea sp.]